MKCGYKFLEGIDRDFPVNEVDIYRVIEDQGNLYIRLDVHGEKHYIKFTPNDLYIYSPYIKGLIESIEFENCSKKEIIEEIIYNVILDLGEYRARLLEMFDSLFDKITSGEVKNTQEIKALRLKVLTLYSDSQSLYYVSKKLSKLIDQTLIEDVQFSLSRAETLLTRSSDLYNIYLTQVQNDLNVVIKKLTSISFIFLPITAIASLYAVSFSSIVENFYNIYSIVFVVPLIVLGILMTIYLRRIGWL
jgi:magnesium transporter